MIDSRNGRILESGERMMIGEREFALAGGHGRGAPRSLDHLMLASSVPWLMPPAIGDLEALNERAADRPGGAADSLKSCAGQAISSTGRRSTNPSFGSGR